MEGRGTINGSADLAMRLKLSMHSLIKRRLDSAILCYILCNTSEHLSIMSFEKTETIHYATENPSKNVIKLPTCPALHTLRQCRGKAIHCPSLWATNPSSIGDNLSTHTNNRVSGVRYSLHQRVPHHLNSPRTRQLSPPYADRLRIAIASHSRMQKSYQCVVTNAIFSGLPRLR